MGTGLSVYYLNSKEQCTERPLSRVYEKSGINLEELSKFCRALEAICQIKLRKCLTPWGIPGKGRRKTDSSINEDYELPEDIGNPEHFKHTEIGLKFAFLIWETMRNVPKDQLYGRYRPNRSFCTEEKPSKAISLLMDLKWIPQKNDKMIEFVRPREAVAEKLPEDFVYQSGWEWLQALEFGKCIEEKREAQKCETEYQAIDNKRKKDAAEVLGFDSPEEAEEIARLKREHPEAFQRLKSLAIRNESNTCKDSPTFPTRPVANPERRQERLGEQLTDAPDKEYEKRERSVRTTNGAIDPITWLRNQYTNEADQMVCQICKEEMPFRKRDGAHYFEKKEALSKKYLPKEHEAQYLALCPLCAAKYNEFVKTDDEVMAELREEIVSAEDCEIPISLGDEKTSIRFVETHLHDLKVIMDEAG